MQVTADITLDDLIFTIVHFAHPPANSAAPPTRPVRPGPVREQLPILIIILLFTAAAVVFVAAFTGSFPVYDRLLTDGLYFAAFLLFFVGVILVNETLKYHRRKPPPSPAQALEAALRKQVASGDRDPDTGPHTVTLTENGIEVIHANVRFSRTWRSTRSIVELPEHIVFCRDQMGGMPIPKRAFPTPDAAAAFLAQARRLHAGARATPQ